MSILEFRKKLYLTIIFYIREVFEIFGVKEYNIRYELSMCVTTIKYTYSILK